MQILVYCLIFCLFSIDWAVEVLGILPRSASYFVELFAVMFACASLLVGLRRKRLDIDAPSLLILFFLVAAYLGSSFINHLSPGTAINGVRSFLKFLPFFILPLVYFFSIEQLRRQFYLLLGLSALQTVVAFVQRFIIYSAVKSGDPIGGTLGANASGTLSVWMACVIAMVLGFFLAKRISKKFFVIISTLLVAPMMINETKVSFLLIPIALILPAFFSQSGTARATRLAMTATATILVIALFIPVYQTLKPSADIVEWFTGEQLSQYVYRGSAEGGGRDDVKRLDSVLIAYDKLKYENARLFGLGPGNVSPAFSRQYEGKYFRRYEHFVPRRVQISSNLWETGMIGTGLLILLILRTAQISIKMSKKCEQVFYRAFATGWIGVSAVILFTMAYFATFYKPLFVCLFWFYAGTIVAESHRQSGSLRAVGTRKLAAATE